MWRIVCKPVCNMCALIGIYGCVCRHTGHACNVCALIGICGAGVDIQVTLDDFGRHVIGQIHMYVYVCIYVYIHIYISMRYVAYNVRRVCKPMYNCVCAIIGICGAEMIIHTYIHTNTYLWCRRRHTGHA